MAILSVNDSTSLVFPKNLSQQDFWMSFSFYQYKPRFAGGQTGTDGSLTDKGTIRLPLPNMMIDHQDVEYSQEEMGLLAGAAIAGLTGSNTTLDAIKNIVIGGVSGLGVAGAVKLVNSIPETNHNVANILTQLKGVAINPFLTVMFKSPAFKKHAFRWTLSPSNEDESKTINSIIDTFRFNQLPSRVSASAGTLLAYPNIILLSVSKNDKDYFSYRFKPAVIESFAVNFAPSGQPSFFGSTNAPTQIEIFLSLLEIEYFLQEDLASATTAGAAFGNSVASFFSNFLIEAGTASTVLPF